MPPKMIGVASSSKPGEVLSYTPQDIKEHQLVEQDKKEDTNNDSIIFSKEEE